MKISLLGYMGSGKTTIGTELAAELNMEFIDLDVYLESQHDKSISDIFKSEGEIKFRKFEREALEEVLERNENIVLSLGGGTPAYYNNMELVNQHAFSIYLRLTPKELISRLTHEKSVRPLIAHLSEAEMPEFIAKHLFERRPFYEEAKFKIDVKEKSPFDIVGEIKSLLAPHLP